MTLQLNGMRMQLAGEFTLRKLDANTREVIQEVGPFSNLITDLGLNQIATQPSVTPYCYVGTGTVPPAVTDTTMSAFKANSPTGTGPVQTPPSSPNWVGKASYTYTFAAGTISANITEVGVGWLTTSVNSLWSRELIVDSSGNPIAITILPTELLEVVYTLSFKVPTDDFTGSFVLNGITYNYTGRAANATTWKIMQSSGMAAPGISVVAGAGVTLGSITGTLVGGETITGGMTSSPSMYTPYSFTRAAVSSFGLSAGNAATGLQGFRLTPAGSSGQDSSFLAFRYQCVLDKPIPKTALNTMSFSISHTWGRALAPLV